MDRTELIVATVIILFATFALGWLAHWMFHRFYRVSVADINDLERLSEELHSAEEARDQAINQRQMREAELLRQNREKDAELKATMDGLHKARQELEHYRAQSGTVQTGSPKS
ncbi:MAG: hypothetical protein OXC68_02780 [Aestuariivita sp.]|nr:hypothetical protein [Aestuariivita sp.]